jgi:hypothetical protein
MDKKAGAFQAVSVWFQALKRACFLPGKGFSATSTGLYALHRLAAVKTSYTTGTLCDIGARCIKNNTQRNQLTKI